MLKFKMGNRVGKHLKKAIVVGAVSVNAPGQLTIRNKQGHKNRYLLNKHYTSQKTDSKYSSMQSVVETPVTVVVFQDKCDTGHQLNIYSNFNGVGENVAEIFTC